MPKSATVLRTKIPPGYVKPDSGAHYNVPVDLLLRSTLMCEIRLLRGQVIFGSTYRSRMDRFFDFDDENLVARTVFGVSRDVVENARTNGYDAIEIGSKGGQFVDATIRDQHVVVGWKESARPRALTSYLEHQAYQELRVIDQLPRHYAINARISRLLEELGLIDRTELTFEDLPYQAQARITALQYASSDNLRRFRVRITAAGKQFLSQGPR